MKPKTLIITHDPDSVIVVAPRSKGALMGKRFDRVIIIDDPNPTHPVDKAKLERWIQEHVLPSVTQDGFVQRLDTRANDPLDQWIKQYQQSPLEIKNPCPVCGNELRELGSTGRLRCENVGCSWRSPPTGQWLK